MTEVEWDIRREGRAWSGDEWRTRREVTPEKITVPPDEPATPEDSEE